MAEEQTLAAAHAFRAPTTRARPRKIRQYVVGALATAAFGAVVGLADAAEPEASFKADSKDSSGANAVTGETRSGTEAIGLVENGDGYQARKGSVGDALAKTVNGGARAADSESRVQIRIAQNAVGAPTSETTRPSLDQAANSDESCELWNDPKVWENATIRYVTGCLAAGIDPDARDHGGWTRLHYAARYSTDPEIVNALVEAGADPNARGQFDRTPLHLAASSSTAEVVEALLVAGADPNAEDVHGFKTLGSAIYNSSVGPEVIAMLVAFGADPNARENDDKTQLHDAVSLLTTPERDRELFSYLFGENSDPCDHDKGSGFCDSIRRAASRAPKIPEIVRALLVAGADPNAQKRRGETPLHLLVEGSTFPEILEVARELLEAGADPNIRDERGKTPLHVAAEHSEIPDVIDLLIEAGADPVARSNSGEFPADLAEENQSMRGTDVYQRLNDARLNAQ